MARCGCAGQTCSCLIQGGDGIEVTGSGTVGDPYVVSTGDVDISGTVQFVDTDTIDFSVTGEGTEVEPYQIRANLIGSLGDLSNVDCDIAPAGQTLVSDGEMWQCGLPDMALDDLSNVDVADAGANNVLTYNATTGQWEPGVVSVEPGQVNTAHGAAGDGTASTPVIVQTPAEWGGVGGELEGMGAGGQTQDGGMPVYIDTLGNVRTPRGLYLYMATAGSSAPAGIDPFWNQGSILLGDRTVDVSHGVAVERFGTTFSERAYFYVSSFNDLAAGGMQVTQYPLGADPADPATFDLQTTLIQRADGQILTRTTEAGVATTRPSVFATAQGTSGHTGDANEGRPVTVTFPARRFTATPRVFMQVITGTSNAGSTNTETWVSNVTTSAATLYVNRSNSTSVSAWWLAIQTEREAVPLTALASASTFGVQTLVGDEVVDDGLATCHTAGCGNEGIPIPVPLTYPDPETGAPIPMPPGAYQCGVCGQPITDVVPVS